MRIMGNGTKGELPTGEEKPGVIHVPYTAAGGNQKSREGEFGQVGRLGARKGSERTRASPALGRSDVHDHSVGGGKFFF